MRKNIHRPDENINKITMLKFIELFVKMGQYVEYKYVTKTPQHFYNTR